MAADLGQVGVTLFAGLERPARFLVCTSARLAVAPVIGFEFSSAGIAASKFRASPFVPAATGLTSAADLRQSGIALLARLQCAARCLVHAATGRADISIVGFKFAFAGIAASKFRAGLLV